MNWQKSDELEGWVPLEPDTLMLPINTKFVSDGHHTFGELYEYRLLYNAAFFNMLAAFCSFQGQDNLKTPVKSKKHSDGFVPFDDPDWFIVVWQSPYGQISNHYRMRYWDYFKIPSVELAPEYDGHNSVQAKERLEAWLTE